MQPYAAADIQRLFHIPASLLRALTRAGHITPVEADAGTHYSFQDLRVLRTAGALKDARISAPKILAALRKIQESLGEGESLAAVSVAPLGREVALRDGTRLWEPASGQYALPLAVAAEPATATVRRLDVRGRSTGQIDAQHHFERGYALEESDREAARAAYLDCLALHAEHVDARINLGRLLHLAGDFVAAESVYRESKVTNALLAFNLAIVLEDLLRETDAIASYREALALDPSLHDAHYNLAQLYERASRPQDALRHLLAYQRSLRRN